MGCFHAYGNERGCFCCHTALSADGAGEGFAAGQGEIGYRANVRACIKRIRGKFRALDPGFACIANYPSFGYRWEVDPLPTGK